MIDTPEFQSWFGDSQVVDAEGKPLVLYHGTAGDFDAFETRTVFFTNNSGLASEYAIGFGKDRGRSGANVIPVFLAIKNPKRLDFLPPNTQGWYTRRRNSLINQGYDGIITSDGLYVSFYPEQIKSSIGNSGRFDPADPDITDGAARLENKPSGRRLKP